MNRIEPGLHNAPGEVDVLVIGLGVTGAGVALDAAARGLSVLAVDAHDVAFGTSRWSSKLVHGGLRYLAHGQVGVAHESAQERGILLERTAPHLTHPIPMLVPLSSRVGAAQAGITRAGFFAGDLLRRGAGTDDDTLPKPSRIPTEEALRLAPGLRREGLRGALLSWDGQLEDDARLVLTLARTAASLGAHVRTRARVLQAGRDGVRLRDELTGVATDVRARTVISATGVWAADLDPGIRLQPSRGTHLVLRPETLPGLRAVVTAPVPGSTSRFVMVLPQPDGRVYVGLTDEPTTGPVPDVPTPSEPEIGFLLDVAAAAFDRPLRRSDVAGAYAGLRPLLQSNDERTADISREHAVLTSASGTHTIVGGKLTTYRAMAEDVLDHALAADKIDAGPCRTTDLPLLGAAPRGQLSRLELPRQLVRRYGTEAAYVLAEARTHTGLSDDELTVPITDTHPTCMAELVFGVLHEGAVSVEDLLERRTRAGLIASDGDALRGAAVRALSLA